MIVDYSVTIEPLMFIKRFGHRPSSMITQLILCQLHVDVVVVVVNCVIIDEGLWPKRLINIKGSIVKEKLLLNTLIIVNFAIVC